MLCAFKDINERLTDPYDHKLMYSENEFRRRRRLYHARVYSFL